MRENKTLEALKAQLDENLSHAPGGLEATISIMLLHKERLMYQSLTRLVENESTSPEVIVLFWKELWAASDNDIPRSERKKLIRLIIDNPHGIKLIVLASHIVQDIFDYYSVKRSKYHVKMDLNEYLFNNIAIDKPSNIDIDAANKLLVLFDEKCKNFNGYRLAASPVFPTELVYRLSLDGNVHAQQASYERIDEFRQKALELIFEQTGEDLHGAPNSLLWNLLQWNWLSDNQ